MSDQIISHPKTASCLPFPYPLFREYIGPMPTSSLLPIKFSDVPNWYPNVHFHFILSFARDYDDNDCPTGGHFKPHWNQVNLGPQDVQDIKAKHQNVKVVLGIGGREYGKFPFDPSCDYDSWTRNAAATIQKIIDDYNLDGVEVNYESINVGKDDFAYCIGELIKKLKEANPDGYVSMAPSADVQAHYRALYEKYNGYIDMVDYQIYTHHPQTVDEFVELYRCKKKVYKQNLLVGLSVDVKDTDQQQPAVFELGCSQLKSEGELQGIFIWSAHDSKQRPFQFYFETWSQNLLRPAT